MSTQQSLNFERVHAKIGAVIVAFCAARVGQQFHLADLDAYVRARVEVSPDSSSRILRALRQSGRLNYRVVSRAASLYEVLPVEESEAA